MLLLLLLVFLIQLSILMRVFSLMINLLLDAPGLPILLNILVIIIVIVSLILPLLITLYKTTLATLACLIIDTTFSKFLDNLNHKLMLKLSNTRPYKRVFLMNWLIGCSWSQRYLGRGASFSKEKNLSVICGFLILNLTEMVLWPNTMTDLLTGDSHINITFISKKFFLLWLKSPCSCYFCPWLLLNIDI